MSSVITIPALGDNFIYLCQYDQGNGFAVDPCESEKVLKALKEHDLKLTHILVTHHHWDHTGGVSELKAATGCAVVGGDGRRIAGIDKVVGDGDIVTLGEKRIRVIGTPGHTLTSVCYYMEGNVERVYGDNRFETGVALAEHENLWYEEYQRDYGPDEQDFVFATGDNFPDSLTGSTLSEEFGTLLLTSSIDDSIDDAFCDSFYKTHH